MGDYLAAVSLVDCTTIEPVIVNQRPLFLGITRAADLDGWDPPPPFTSDDGVDVADARASSTSTRRYRQPPLLGG